ncbi:MAG TPA: DMT family transporter [Acidimicrobiia bacterium]|nr:DMT family transporter [Acidimicrobiia bacterium]
MQLRALVLLVLASFGFGAGNIITKAILNLGVDPMTVIPGRYLVALVILFSGLALTRRLQTPGGNAWWKGMLLGVINMAAPTILTTAGLAYIPASVTAMLVALIPVTTVITAHFLIAQEPMRASLLPGFLLALVGCVFLVRGDIATGPNFGLGLGLILAGILAASLGGALTRRFILVVPASRLLVPQFVGAGIVVLVTALAFGGLSGLADLSSREAWLIVLSGTVATALPFVTLLMLAEIATAAKTSLVAYLVPLIGVTGSVTLLREALTPGLVIGGVLILTGVVLAERAERRQPLAVPPL